MPKENRIERYEPDLETVGRRLKSLAIRPPSDFQVLLDGKGLILTFPRLDQTTDLALDDLLRALDAAQEDLQSHRSRADPELARHRKRSTDAHIQRLLQQFLSAEVSYLASAISHRHVEGTGTTARMIVARLKPFGFSKDFVARVIQRAQKSARKDGWID